MIKQRFGLVYRALEALPLAEDLDIVDARLPVLWLELYRALKEELSVLQNAMPGGNFCQYAHPVDMLRILLHELPAQLLGFVQLALVKQVPAGQESRR